MSYFREVQSATGCSQDLFQVIVWGDPKTPAVGQRDLYESTSEDRPKISDVVELAVLRGELE